MLDAVPVQWRVIRTIRPKYIADVIAKIAADRTAARWDELIPWNWQPDQQPIAEAA